MTNSWTGCDISKDSCRGGIDAVADTRPILGKPASGRLPTVDAKSKRAGTIESASDAITPYRNDESRTFHEGSSEVDTGILGGTF